MFAGRRRDAQNGDPAVLFWALPLSFLAERDGMEKEFEYSASKAGGERSIILNDLSKDFPTQRLKVVGFEVRKGKSGTDYPCLLLMDDEGKKFSASAWDRDVEECVNEWGKKPSLWRGNYVVVKKGQYSGSLVPASDQTPPEERIGG